MGFRSYIRLDFGTSNAIVKPRQDLDMGKIVSNRTSLLLLIVSEPHLPIREYSVKAKGPRTLQL